MIEIKNIKNGDEEYEQFTLLNDGFYPTGFVQMECRNSDMNYEGFAFFIDVSTDMPKHSSEKYHYAPLEMNKEELGKFIEYLQTRYNELP